MRDIRCQGVILKGDTVLVARQYNFKRNEEFWLLPGGGVNKEEIPEEAFLREIKEETLLDVEIKQVLFDDIDKKREYTYSRYITYLCVLKDHLVPEVGSETNDYKKILDLIWCPIKDETKWNKYILNKQFNPPMTRIKNELLKLNYIK